MLGSRRRKQQPFPPAVLDVAYLSYIPLCIPHPCFFAHAVNDRGTALTQAAVCGKGTAIKITLENKTQLFSFRNQDFLMWLKTIRKPHDFHVVTSWLPQQFQQRPCLEDILSPLPSHARKCLVCFDCATVFSQTGLQHFPTKTTSPTKKRNNWNATF